MFQLKYEIVNNKRIDSERMLNVKKNKGERERRISYVNDIRFRNLIKAIIHRVIYLETTTKNIFIYDVANDDNPLLGENRKKQERESTHSALHLKQE